MGHNRKNKGGIFVSAYNDDRIALEPAPVKAGDTVHIKYHGLLRNSGADSVYLHYGKDGWNDTQTIPMNQFPDGEFSAEVKADAGNEVNFCFKDSANNWDNNNGWNWKCDVVHY
jgi:hypothetical protein